jgi:hypothetical protein
MVAHLDQLGSYGGDSTGEPSHGEGMQEQSSMSQTRCSEKKKWEQAFKLFGTNSFRNGSMCHVLCKPGARQRPLSKPAVAG